MKIGFFDSGLGGLVILKSVSEHLPQYDYLYYGDTKHLPYGERSESEIYELTKHGVEVLFKSGAVLVIIACNTACAETLRKLQDSYLLNSSYSDRKILGVIIPTIESVIDAKMRETLLIGTKRTIDSKKYQIEFGKAMIKPIMLTQVATPGLVPLIENKKYDEAVRKLEEILLVHAESGGDSVILGCTHYSFLKTRLRGRYNLGLIFFSQDEIIPLKLEKYLSIHPEIKEKLSANNTREVLLTKEKEYDLSWM